MKILTFDIEEWFHLLDNPSTKTEQEWNNFESRILDNMEIIFDIVDKANVSATFFVVGWVAKKYPEIVRKIAERGYQIGSHTNMHQLCYEQNRATFYNDVETSIKTIEDCIGKKVELFRAPGFSIVKQNIWAFEVLHELGITTDSSIVTGNHAHGGIQNFPENRPSLIRYNGITLKEFPIKTTSILARPIIFSGGGYFRLFPYSFIKKATDKSDYVMSYFHPRDFDINQPVIKDLSLKRKLKSYVGLHSTKVKLEKWLHDFDFIDIKNADTKMNWENAKLITLD